MLEGCIRHRRIFIPLFLAACAAAFLLAPWLGQDFFPATDAGRFNLHFRTKTATRIEETAAHRRPGGSRDSPRDSSRMKCTA